MQKSLRIRHYIFHSVCLAIIFTISSCKKDEVIEPDANFIGVSEFEAAIPEFHLSSNLSLLPNFTIIADNSDRVNGPQDLDFHPSPSREGELWIINKGTENAPTFGGSTVTIYDAGETSQTSELRQDGNAWHFMSLPTAIAFGNGTYNGEFNFATSTGVYDANHDGGDFFTGPSLWSSDMDVYARPSGGNGSHLDMLHGSPYSMGIAHEEGNAYWVFDGYHQEIVRYDFVEDHGPGADYHGDAIIQRYPEVRVTRDPEVPSHMVLDKSTGWLYICETSQSRILRLNINSGNVAQNLPLLNEPLAEHSEIGNVEWEVFYDSDLEKPCGIDIVENRLFVSDFETGDIICYNVDTKMELARITTDATEIMGIKVGPVGKIWYVDYAENEVVRVDPR